ncbi:MAG: endonuclease domain-containing protein [Flavobacteriales bacterium]
MKFRRQHPIDTFILDFYCHSLKLSIELDGGYHMRPDQKESDLKRTKSLSTLGILELRFKNEVVLTDITKVLKRIKLKINEQDV